MAFILDGYNRRAVIRVGSTDVKVIYRPFHSAFASDRKRFYWEARHLGERARRRAIDQFLFRQIVDWDMGLDASRIAFLRTTNESAFDHLSRLIHGREVDASGERWRDVEKDWSTNLREGVILDLTAPRIANRSCAECQKFWYLDNGLVAIRASTGEKELRPEFALTACQTEFGCPKGTPENQKSLTAANQWAWHHFKACDSIGVFPDDDLVRYNAGVIRKAMVEAERLKTQEKGKR